jgi:hypothetical protein
MSKIQIAALVAGAIVIGLVAGSIYKSNPSVPAQSVELE